MFYTIFDRLSNRHNWQIICETDNANHAEFIRNNQLNTFDNWNKKNQYPDYQIGVIESDEKINHDGTLPKNYKMTYILLWRKN